MGCLFAIFAAGAPRLAFLFYWIARPLSVQAAFGGSWFWPLLGFLLVPFTTLMYVLLYTPGIGIVGWDWLWLILAFVLDIGATSSEAYRNRNYAGMGTSNPT
jgi:hypothetical protein